MRRSISLLPLLICISALPALLQVTMASETKPSQPFAPKPLTEAELDIPSPFAGRQMPPAAPDIQKTLPPQTAPPIQPVPAATIPATAPVPIPTVPTSESPPPLPVRPPIPSPPPIKLLPPKKTSQRTPLAWRARAHELTNSLRGSKFNGVRLTKDFASNPNETFAALAQACDQAALSIDGISVPARHLLARLSPPQDKIAIVFAAEQSTTSGTTVAVGLLPDSKNFKTAVISDILSKVESILNSKGLF